MPMNESYDGPGDLPEVIPVFPLAGALLLPRGQMPLNIFEPRYLAMIDDALRLSHRLIGMIQPDGSQPGSEARPRLYRVGCVGRITQFAEFGRRALPDPSHRRRALSRRRGAGGPDTLPPVPRALR